MMNPNLILLTDSYKFSHWKQYPKGTSEMYSYFEARGGRWDKTLFFGLQYFIKQYLSTPITNEDVDEAVEFCNAHGTPFNEDGWRYIVDQYGGNIPVTIKAIPEGSVVPTGNILFSIECADEKVFWVASYLETLFVNVWYPMAVATNSWEAKQLIKPFLERSTDDPKAEISFKLHDFGARGATTPEAAMIGGAAHLVNFLGSDTVAGVWAANKFYNCKMSGFSIPASEHSTMTMWGRENEVKAYDNMIDAYGDQPIFACVSDSYDIYNAAENLWGDALIQRVKQMNAMLVVRPDSGDPVDVICHLLEILEKKFDYSTNTKGFKVLNNVRVIQGDGINNMDVVRILSAAEALGYSATNINFGMGGGLLQKDLNRDTSKVAFKCSYAKVNGGDVMVYKDPVTDQGKRSKKGKLNLFLKGENEVRTLPADGGLTFEEGLMQTVFVNGELLIDQNLEDIRERSEKQYEQYVGWVDRDCY
jgi:nicotinamide phosphoribosyltransferase